MRDFDMEFPGSTADILSRKDKPTLKTRYADIPTYVTKDGSEIRELLHPAHHGCRNQSLAEAAIPPGTRTLLHQHLRTEEIYHVTSGCGRMTLGQEVFDVSPGDSILIPPGTPHCIEAIGPEPLRILCCCSPAYCHEDTTLLDPLTPLMPS
jgi:mannose-6-phosphate isomerase-like protein (cupin superfamily)